MRGESDVGAVIWNELYNVIAQVGHTLRTVPRTHWFDFYWKVRTQGSRSNVGALLAQTAPTLVFQELLVLRVRLARANTSSRSCWRTAPTPLPGAVGALRQQLSQEPLAHCTNTCLTVPTPPARCGCCVLEVR